jgi:hypothetical protein
MFQTVFVGLLLTLLATLAISQVSQSRHLQYAAQDAAASKNFAVYANVMSTYAKNHAGFTGKVSPTTAGMPTWFSPLPGMTNYLSAGVAYVYVAPPSEPSPAQLLSALAPDFKVSGLKSGGNLVDATGRVVRAAPAAIPAGSIVVAL